MPLLPCLWALEMGRSFSLHPVGAFPFSFTPLPLLLSPHIAVKSPVRSSQ